MYKHTIILILSLAILCGCGGGTKSQKPLPIFAPPTKNKTSRNKQSSSQIIDDEMGPQELQAAIMAYADTTNSMMAQAAAIIDMIGTPQARLTAARMLVFNTASNVEIAAGPYPGIALLDIVVLASLRHMVWQDFWVADIFGDEAIPALELFAEAEAEAWELAAKVMTQEEMDELKQVILQWRAKNPKAVSVNYVRFAEFGELGLKPSMRKLTVPGGLFSSVKEAAMVAQDMKIAIDRAFYLISRMQLVVSFQAKLAYLEMLFQPETNGLIDTTKEALGMGDRFAAIAENLPEDIRVQASIIMKEMFDHVERQSDETLKEVLGGMSEWQNQMVTDVMTNISKEREAAIDQAVSGLVEQQKALFSRADEIVDKGGNEIEKTLNHAFMLSVLLILVFFLSLTLYRVFVARPLEKNKGA